MGIKSDSGSAQSCVGEARMVVPGFRFHPTDEELVLYYLKRKICRRRLKLDIISEFDVYKFDPEDLPGLCKLKTGDKQWFFFSPRDRKYGSRSNRGAPHGYWKATGKDRTITCNSRDVGNKKTLVFYLGRAPSGQRTDWVMHEYTLEEEELKRCPEEHDYFALYKVFKKSGAGPKNGEQYGAPFREEDWADEDCLDMRVLFGQEGAVKKGGEIVPVNNKESESQVEHPATDLEGAVKKGGEIVPVNNEESEAQLEHPVIDLEELMNQIDDDTVLVQPSDVDYEYALGQPLGEQEFCTTLVNTCSREVSAVEQVNMAQPLYQMYDVQASFDLTQSGTSHLYFNEAPEVSSAPSTDRLQPHAIEEDFLEDFLEMDDLVGSQPTDQDFNHGNPMNFQLEELDGLSELDFFQDAALFLNESGFDDQSHYSQSLTFEFERRPEPPNEPRIVSDRYTNHLEVGLADPGHMSHLDGSSFSTSHSYNFENQILTHQPSQLSGSNQLCDQQYSIFAPPEANHWVNPPITPGMVYDVSSGSNHTELSQNRNLKPGDASGSWLSSALWAFVDSIPTNPASAAETALVNKTLEKMSSFSRLRLASQNLNYASGNTSSDSKSKKSRNGILCFFVVGVLFAILSVFLGTSKVPSRFIFS